VQRRVRKLRGWRYVQQGPRSVRAGYKDEGVGRAEHDQVVEAVRQVPAGADAPGVADVPAEFVHLDGGVRLRHKPNSHPKCRLIDQTATTSAMLPPAACSCRDDAGKSVRGFLPALGFAKNG